MPDVVRAHPLLHRPQPLSLLAVRHVEGASDRSGHPERIVRVHEQGFAQLLRRARELAQTEDPASIALARHVLLSDEVHPIPERGHQRHVRRAVQRHEPLERHAAV